MIRNSPYLDHPEPSPQKRAIEQQFEIFLDSVIPALEMVLQRMNMRLVSGFMALLIEENNILEIAKTPVSAISMFNDSYTKGLVFVFACVPPGRSSYDHYSYEPCDRAAQHLHLRPKCCRRRWLAIMVRSEKINKQ